LPEPSERRRLVLVTHRSPAQSGGGAARWRALARYLPDEGWHVDVVAAPERASSAEFVTDPSRRAKVTRRAQIMSRARALAGPVFAAFGLRPPPLSTLWLLRGALELRRALRAAPADAVLATGPPMVGLLVGRLGTLGRRVPLVVELRDLWAGNPAYDVGGPVLGAVERWIMRGATAVVVCTPEAAQDVSHRHPDLARRLHVIPNGFEPALLERRPVPSAGAPAPPLTILHSGTLVASRPLAPLLEVLALERYRSSLRLVLHGYVVPEILAEVEAHRDAVDVEMLPPSDWEEAVRRIAQADVGLITQSHSAGDATAVAAKVYEYLALGRPVLCLTHGGATEALLRRLGADRFTANLDDPHAIAAALDALLADAAPAPLTAEALEPYSRRRHATALAALLEGKLEAEQPAVREHAGELA
jgi:glycosyltransferase involved in cell wall biosynthesis